MSKGRIFLLLAVVMLVVHTSDADKNLALFKKARIIIDILTQHEKSYLSELVKTNRGRAQLRRLVADFRMVYTSLLEVFHHDTRQLRNRLHNDWKVKTWAYFRGANATTWNTANIARAKILSSLPFVLRTKNSSFPKDPYVVDPTFFERLFHLRAPWRSFHFANNTYLTRIYNQYKKLWMKSYANNTLLSDAVFMWFEHSIERVVSIVTEWEIHGVWTDVDDIYDYDIPFYIIPTEVLDSFDNNNLYIQRMSQHNHIKNSLLFYGLPVGFRQPGKVPMPEISQLQAEIKLSKIVSEMKDNYDNYELAMDYLAKVANQYLFATELENEYCQDPPTCSRLIVAKQTEISNASRVLSCVNDEARRITECSHCIQEVDFFSDQSMSLSLVMGDSFYMRNTLDEQLFDCMDKNAMNKKRYKKFDECKRKLNHYVMMCGRKLLLHVSKSTSQVRRHTKVIRDKTDMTISCDVFEVLRIYKVSIAFADSVVTTKEAVFNIPQIKHPLTKDDMKKKVLELYKEKCNGKNNCSYHTDIELISSNSNIINQEIVVDFECTSKSCSSDLYEEKSVRVRKDDLVSLQCENEDEIILITGAEWSSLSFFNMIIITLQTCELLFYNLSQADLDIKTQEFFKLRCNGKNKCGEIASLYSVTRLDALVIMHLEVNYKCLFCPEFTSNKKSGN